MKERSGQKFDYWYNNISNSQERPHYLIIRFVM